MLKYMKALLPSEIPKVLLLGNGINRAFESMQWDDLLKGMSDEGVKADWDHIKTLPYPLMAVVATKDNVGEQMKIQAAKMCAKSISDEQTAIIKSISSVEFDAVLTTNYTYEIEQALDTDFKIEIGKPAKYRCKTCKDKSRYDTASLYQFMDIMGDGKHIPVWHIHGEAAKPDTMVIGHYYYGRLLYHIEKYVSETIKRYKTASKSKTEFYPRSWVDYILFGDVYIIGQGMDFSEIDLWWLINCKKRNGVGKVYFFEPDLSKEKKLLAETYGVNHISLKVEDDDFKKYYKDVFMYIKKA